MSVLRRHWKTTTFIVGVCSGGIVAPYVVGCPVDCDIFEAWVEQALLRQLRPGDIVGMDNPSSHQGPRVRALTESHCAGLPPYSPDFNAVENTFAKFQALLFREAARTVEALRSAIGQPIDLITPKECQNMFAAAGYDPD